MDFIYHITKKQTWNEAKAKNIYDYCTLKTSGFIHASTKEQYQNIVDTKFTEEKDLILLKIDPTKVSEKIVYENLEGGSELYPHIYGPLKIDAVIEVLKL